jgi:hypothetical protein
VSKEELLTKVVVLEGKLKVLSEKPKNVPTEFGKEDMTYINQKLGDIIRPIIEHHIFTSIPRLFNQIHSNENLPEYHNVYLPNEISHYALVSDGKTFKHKPKKIIIDQVIRDKRSLLDHYVDENKEQFGKKILGKYERFQKKLDEDGEFKKDLEVEIGGLLLDMNDVIANANA